MESVKSASAQPCISSEQPKNSTKPAVLILRNHYPVVKTLVDYLELPERGRDNEILKETLVGLGGHVIPLRGDHIQVDPKAVTDSSARQIMEGRGNDVTMPQLVEAAQSILLWRASQIKLKSNPCRSNVLTLGCRLSNNVYPEMAIPIMNGPYANNLVSKYVASDMTTNKFITQSHVFADLLARIGTKRMMNLLTETSIFYPTGNSCYFQLTGKPVFDLPFLAEGQLPQKANTLVDVVLAKKDLMYTRVRRGPTGINQIGFVTDYVLCQIHDPTTSFSNNHLKAVHLSKHIFPSQYSLDSFNGETHSEAVRKLRNFKTPRRLKPLIQPNGFLHKVVVKSKSVEVIHVLNRSCPSKFVNCNVSAEERLSLIELAEPIQGHSLESTHCSMSVDSSHTQLLSFQGPSQSNKPPTPKFSRFVCTPHEVETFLWAMIHACGLSHWWGWHSKHNEDVVRNSIRLIIKLRMFEKISLHQLAQNLKFKACDEWISQNSQDHHSEAMLHDFLWWFYFSFIGGLIKNTFFVTESASFRNRTLYFRLDDWEQICHPLIKYLKTTLFTKVDEKNVGNSQSQLGHSFLRLLPKNSGVRPIVNLKRKSSSQTGLSNNSILQNLFSVLSYEKNVSPDRMEYSVLGLDHIYTRFKKFRSQFGDSLPELYFVKVDIRACFDSIQQDKILEVINGIFSEDQYVIQKYVKTSSLRTGPQKTFRQFKRQAYPSDEVPDFDKFAIELSRTLKNILLCDQAQYAHVDKQELTDLLREHITQNFVKIGAGRYQQKTGIPQGSIMSPLLCSLFYADMDKERLGFTKTPNSILVRLIDDFIYITTSQNDAECFLKVMAEGSKEYGCFISMEKTLINFKYGGVKQVVGNEFPWCGHLINTKTLEFKAEMARFNGIHLSDTLTVDRTKTPGQHFCQKMYQSVRVRIHVIYLDSTLNSISTVLLNVYQALRLIAAKYVAHVIEWGADTVKGWKFFHDVIKKTLIFFFACTQKQVEQKYVKDVGGCCNIKLRHIIWLGRQAFRITLARKPHRFGLVLKQIQADLKSQSKLHINRLEKMKLEAIIKSKENLALDQLKY
ncbi:hypothetical protein PGT21_035536 [Puccinia graminis f. sp. tritici]|uniref:Telomerase reverse transcriptase n=1 Tax=Puccinia graminis f. sp. tritici TaxID=56615 RepID=A0A5B0RX29_PUCGR|nr:hypothetical protein PGT21_035536 [Puccinia graminis f. sp. tritici]KAA1130157.1 hypothetical protein PGTUg99_009563 [Puccinia graminis f. sp. tritici]